MKVKTLKWETVKPEVFEDFSYNAKVNGLFLNRESAYYQINSVNGDVGAQFWIGNRAFQIKGFYKHTNEAKKVCQEHYEKMILSNLEL